MTRAEFSPATKRLALSRSGGRCEAVGAVYGHAPGHRCNALFAHKRKEFDHYPLRAADGGSNDLDNCFVVCTDCHSFKTRTFDTPQAAKGKRVSDKYLGIRSKSGLTSRAFKKAPPQKTASTKPNKWSAL